MVVKKRKSKVKRKIKTTKRRRKNPNPSLFAIRDHMEIKTKPLDDGTGRYFLAVYYAGQPIIREIISAKGAALINTPAGRDRIARDIKDVIEELSKDKIRSNPDKENKEEKTKKSSSSEWTSPAGLPASQLESWYLGYDAGLEEGIEMCGIFDFFKRREVKEQLSKKINQHFRDLTSQLKAAASGTVGARVPRVRAGNN